MNVKVKKGTGRLGHRLAEADGNSGPAPEESDAGTSRRRDRGDIHADAVPLSTAQVAVNRCGE
jgi:hypothetical protein